eukprot:380815-Prymnesium_polylepis.1
MSDHKGRSMRAPSPSESRAPAAPHGGFGMTATASGLTTGCVLGDVPPVDCPMPVARGMGEEATVEPRA